MNNKERVKWLRAAGFSFSVISANSGNWAGRKGVKLSLAEVRRLSGEQTECKRKKPNFEYYAKRSEFSKLSKSYQGKVSRMIRMLNDGYEVIEIAPVINFTEESVRQAITKYVGRRRRRGSRKK